MIMIGEESGGSATDSGDLSAISQSFINECLGSSQSYLTPLYTQLFAKINEHGAEGISIKKLGTLFGLDFYKSRRMGANLQAHPDVVTIIKETSRMRAKYQTVMLRKYLHANQAKTFQQADAGSTSAMSRANSALNLVNNIFEANKT